MNTLTRSQQIQAQRLAAEGAKLDVGDNRKYSYGTKAGVKNMISESAQAMELSWKITNKTDSDVIFLFSTFFGNDSSNTTQFETIDELLEATASDYTFAPGTLILGKGAGDVPNGKDLIVTSLKTGRSISHFLRYAGQSPLRFTRWSLKSKQISTGAKDSSNYDNEIKSFWFSPFDDPQIDYLNLRPLQRPDAFNADLLDIDFLDQNFRMQLDNEHFIQMKVNSNTELTMSVYVGAQDSRSQAFYRFLNKADDVMLRERVGMLK